MTPMKDIIRRYGVDDLTDNEPEVVALAVLRAVAKNAAVKEFLEAYFRREAGVRKTQLGPGWEPWNVPEEIQQATAVRWETKDPNPQFHHRAHVWQYLLERIYALEGL